MQSMPGRGNAIPHLGETMNNWWLFTADWDRAIREGWGLYGPPARLVFWDGFESGGTGGWSSTSN